MGCVENGSVFEEEYGLKEILNEMNTIIKKYESCKIIPNFIDSCKVSKIISNVKKVMDINNENGKEIKDSEKINKLIEKWENIVIQSDNNRKKSLRNLLNNETNENTYNIIIEDISENDIYTENNNNDSICSSNDDANSTKVY